MSTTGDREVERAARRLMRSRDPDAVAAAMLATAAGYYAATLGVDATLALLDTERRRIEALREVLEE